MALAFIIFAGVSAGVFFLFLCYTIYRVFLTIAQKQVSYGYLDHVMVYIMRMLIMFAIYNNN